MFSGTGAEVCAQARAEGLDVLEPTMDVFVGHLQEACSGFDPAAHPPAPLDKHGWMDPYIMRVFNKLDASRPILMVEVGSWKGQSSIAFAQRLQQLGPGHRLVCVDTWLGAPEFWTWGLRDRSRGGSLKPVHGWPTVFYTFLSNVHRSNVQDVIAPLPISSLQGAVVLAYYGCQADAVYIDGAHECDGAARPLRDRASLWHRLSRRFNLAPGTRQCWPTCGPTGPCSSRAASVSATTTAPSGPASPRPSTSSRRRVGSR